MDLRASLAATSLLLLAACEHPVQKAIEAGDYLGACRAYAADPARNGSDPAVIAKLDRWMGEHVDLRVRVERVPMESLRQTEGGDQVAFNENGSVLRVTLTASVLPKGSKAKVEPPMIREHTDARILRPALADDGVVAKAIEFALEEPPPLRLERLPAELLPRDFVQEESGKLVYKDGVDPDRVVMGVLTGGVAWLLQGSAPEPEWAPETNPKVLAALKKASPRKRRAFEKEQARKRGEFEAAKKKRAEDRRLKNVQVEAIAARNREKVAARESLLTARRAFAQKAARQFTPDCPMTDEGAVWLAPGQSCTYLTWGQAKSNYLVADALGVGTDLSVHLSAESKPCVWQMRGFLGLPQSADGPYLETVLKAFQEGERRLGLSGVPR